MKVLHLVSGNRWTGAAAPAFAEVEALRQEGIDAHYAYVGGYKLQAKIGRHDFAHPIIPKAQNPLSFAGAVRAVNGLMEHHGFDILHAHLTYDHLLAGFAVRGWPARIARTFHARRALRSDPLMKALIARSGLICVTNDSLRDAAPIRNRAPLFTPPPIDLAQFRPDGDGVRERYGIPADALLLMAIGKLSKGRGFELVLRTFAALTERADNARLMIVGHGEHRPALESLAGELGIADRTLWAGYQEDELAAHYRAADFLLFAASGSDEGHRAVLEAMACATVPVTVPLAGMPALLGGFAPLLMAADADAGTLAATLVRLVAQLPELREAVVTRAAEFSYAQAAGRLLPAYSAIL